MYDGFLVKAISSIEASSLFKNKILGFTHSVDSLTDELRLEKGAVTTYKGIVFRGYLRTNGTWNVEVRGSIHKYFNDGIHNHDDFSTAELGTALSKFAKDTGIDPSKEELNTIEFGTNLGLPFSPKKVLESLISFRGYDFQRIKDKNGWYYQVMPDSEEFVLKLYEKENKISINANLLRIELKVRSMRYLKNKDINMIHLSDLLNSDYWPKCGNLLKSLFDEIIFDNPSLQPETLTMQQSTLLLSGRAPSYWKHHQKETYSSIREYNKARQKRRREEAAFKSLTETDWQLEIKELLCLKIAELIKVTPEILSQNQQLLEGWQNSDLSQNQRLYIKRFCDKRQKKKPSPKCKNSINRRLSTLEAKLTKEKKQRFKAANRMYKDFTYHN